MTNHDLILLLAGSFLPNNLLIWLFAWLRRQVRREQKHHSLTLISARRYYAKFESDPVTQYYYHKRMQKFWLMNFLPMFGLISIDIWYSLKNGINIQALITAALLALNTIYSLYANFDTETGDAHAAYASLRADQIQGDQREEDTTEDQIESIVDQLEPWSLPTD